MVRIFVDADDTEMFEDIESELDAAGINYDVDDYGRYIIDNADADMAVEIIEDCGGDAEII